MAVVKLLTLSYSSSMTWYAASLAPNCRSTTLSTPSWVMEISRRVRRCLRSWEDGERERERGGRGRERDKVTRGVSVSHTMKQQRDRQTDKTIYFHWESWWLHVLWPFKLCSMKSAAWLKQKHCLFVRPEGGERRGYPTYNEVHSFIEEVTHAV